MKDGANLAGIDQKLRDGVDRYVAHPRDRTERRALDQQVEDEATIRKGDAIEVALCWGWIDGQLDRFDDQYFLVRMTPRRPGSRWSAKNREAVDRLLVQGRLQPPGLAEVEAAKSDGRWEAAYDSQGKAEVPEDLAAALASRETAKRFFETLDRANRYSIIYRVNDAKRTETAPNGSRSLSKC